MVVREGEEAGQGVAVVAVPGLVGASQVTLKRHLAARKVAKKKFTLVSRDKKTYHKIEKRLFLFLTLFWLDSEFFFLKEIEQQTKKNIFFDTQGPGPRPGHKRESPLK